MTIQLRSKLPKVGDTIFATMTQLAMQHQAINLSQGFPSFDPPELLQQRLTQAMQDGANQYSPMSGLPKLRAQIAAKIKALYKRTVAVDDEINVTTGATQAMFVAVSTMVQPGDEVIMFDPAYDAYEPVVELNGGRAIHIPLSPPTYHIDWQRVKDTLSPRTRLIMINTPHNPTGMALSTEDMATLADLVRDTSIVLLSDEVYEHIVFDGRPHQSLLSHPELAERTFVISSFGKTYHATGWKVGYCIAPKPLMREFRKIHQYMVFCTMTPAQIALADFMEQCPDYAVELSNFYQQKRDTFCEAIQSSRFRFQPTASTFFQLLDYSPITDRADTVYARQLVEEIGVASIPVSVFCAEPPSSHLLRFCFAKDDDTLREAGRRLSQV